MTTKFSIFAIMLFFVANVSAQNLKFGHIDSQKLLQELPETAVAKTALEKETKDAEKHITNMQTETQKLYQEYMENEQLAATSPEKWSSLIKSEKETEIQSLQQRMEEFQQSAQASLQKKQTELLQPIIDKIEKAIQDVATEGDFIFVFDDSTLLFSSKTKSIDITDLVKKKLGLTTDK